MKSLKFLAFAFVSALSSASFATIYNDSTGDVVVPGSPFPHLDITSVEVTNTNTSLKIKINLNGDPVATDWGKYMVAIDSAAGGDTSGNGWARPISMSSGMDTWLAGWANSGNGLENRKYTGSWNLAGATYNSTPGLSVSKDSSSYTMNVLLADIGVTLGSSFRFDVCTSGGGNGDGAVDALSNASPQISNWGDQSNLGGLSYTTVVPEPGSLLALSLGLVAVLKRKK